MNCPLVGFENDLRFACGRGPPLGWHQNCKTSRSGLSSQRFQLCGRELPDNHASEETGRAPASLPEGANGSGTSMSEAGKLRKQVATLACFGGRALRSSNIGELLQEATLLVSDAIEVDLVKVLELLPDGENLLVRAGVNWSPGVVGHATISADGGSAAGHALCTDEPVISDLTTESRFNIPTLLVDHGVKSTVNVVIRGDRGPFGVLEVELSTTSVIWTG